VLTIYTVSQKNVHLLFFQQLCQKLTDFNDLWNPEKIWRRYLVHLPTLPVYCNNFTLGNPKKSFFNSITHRDFRNKVQLLYCSLSVYLLLFTTSCYLRSPILWSVFYLFGQSFFKATNADPQPALFRVANSWRNATLSAVRCKSFTFYKVVWWHSSCVVGKGVTVCFSEIT